MKRHLSDTGRKSADGTRLKAYLKLDRETLRHPAYDALHRKPRGTSDRKVVEYARIERGHTA